MIDVTVEVPQTTLTVDIETATVLVANPTPEVLVNVPMQSVIVGVPGPKGPVGTTGPEGPVGPSGLVRIEHGNNPDIARPDAPVVYWIGTVLPNNGDPDDLLMLKEA